MKPNIEYISQLTGGNEHLCLRITEILQLEYQLAHPKEQSWYFKSGLESQKVRLEVLTKKFESFRDTVNAISVEELMLALVEEIKKLSEVDMLNCSRRSRAVARSISRSRINTIQLFQSIKSDAGDLPELNFFRTADESTNVD